MNDQITNYIRENRDRYTRQAITTQLTAAGHDAAAIESAWAQLEAEIAKTEPLTWGQWWLLVFGIVAVGAVVVGVVWSGVPYSYGLAVPVYLVVIGLAMALAAGIAYDTRKSARRTGAVLRMSALVYPAVIIWLLITGTCLAWGAAS